MLEDTEQSCMAGLWQEGSSVFLPSWLLPCDHERLLTKPRLSVNACPAAQWPPVGSVRSSSGVLGFLGDGGRHVATSGVPAWQRPGSCWWGLGLVGALPASHGSDQLSFRFCNRKPDKVKYEHTALELFKEENPIMFFFNHILFLFPNGATGSPSPACGADSGASVGSELKELLAARWTLRPS